MHDIHHQFAQAFNNKSIEPFMYQLSKKLSEGSICINLDTFNLSDEEKESETAPWDIAALKTQKHLVATDTDTFAPIVLYNNKLYFHRYFRYESIVVDKILSLINNSTAQLAGRMERLKDIMSLISSFRETTSPDNQKTDWQLVATLQTVLQDFSIITGGPGTGKTNTLAKVLCLLYTLDSEIKIALAAPTGKAAMRMAEALKNTHVSLPENIKSKIEALQPKTLHNLLGYIPHSIYFQYNERNHLPYHCIVIDEASMIDIPLFAKLLQALRPDGKLILLGDKNQLSSVEAGSLLHDLCGTISHTNQFSEDRIAFINHFITHEPHKIQSPSMHPQNIVIGNFITELQYSRRFKEDSMIGQLSRAILDGNMEALQSFIIADVPVLCNGSQKDDTKNEDVACIDTSIDDHILEVFCEGYKKFIEEKDIEKAIIYFNTTRVLVAVRDGKQGLYAINKKIERILRLDTRDLFYDNRPVLVTKNRYDLGIWNGDVGIIRNKRAYFYTNAGLKDFSPAYFTELETVFAMTIHKSQGSEFDNVLVVLPDLLDSKILTKELLYTGVTRAKKQLVIQSKKDRLEQTIQHTVERISGISERLTIANCE
ncbi:MAG: exodeoxyribonuclease V subunit alpha [Phycisphaerales bacterium]|nr:exodeoxyribonuclease V subunit alpha [Phycisphaerales bacterium]